MKRFFNPFVLALSSILGLLYAYLAWRLTDTLATRLLLALPFVLIWIVPVLYWGDHRESRRGLDDVLHFAGYLGMGWLNFVLLFALLRDALLALAGGFALQRLQALLQPDSGPALVFAASLLALIVGLLAALRGPRLKRIDLPVKGLHADLDGLRIVQISDLHVGSTIRRRYVQRVVDMTNALQPDLVALTGDIIDGPVGRLEKDVSPLAQLQARLGRFLVLGNHEYYAGAGAWVRHFGGMGLQVLLNQHVILERGAARLVVGGVTDPVAAHGRHPQAPQPELAAGKDVGADFRLLLAHNPKLAPAGAAAGFDLQLSGHTHAGQFFPWTLAVRWVHAPHVVGLSREQQMQVYVSPGTGSWGPPIRLGTRTELTLLRLVRA